jgi:hypothetical protein
MRISFLQACRFPKNRFDFQKKVKRVFLGAKSCFSAKKGITRDVCLIIVFFWFLKKNQKKTTQSLVNKINQNDPRSYFTL